jgi:hypothetical protein
VAQLGSAPALGAGGRRFKSYLSDQIKGYIMSINIAKNKRVKFGLFKNETLALAECEKRKHLFPEECTAFYTKKVQRHKEGKNSWLAYCLIRKAGM